MFKPQIKTDNFSGTYTLFFKDNGESKLVADASAVPSGYLYGVDLDGFGLYLVNTPTGSRLVNWQDN